MQMVEIAEAISHDAKILIMDEPTSALSDQEAGTLFRIIKELKAKGVAIIYISHKMAAVSYTHLDVYKRQRYYGRLGHRNPRADSLRTTD